MGPGRKNLKVLAVLLGTRGQGTYRGRRVTIKPGFVVSIGQKNRKTAVSFVTQGLYPRGPVITKIAAYYGDS